VNFRKKSSLNEVEEPVSELIVRTMKFLKLTEELRMTETVIIHSADSDCNEQRATANGQRIARLLVVLLWEVSEGKRHYSE